MIDNGAASGQATLLGSLRLRGPAGTEVAVTRPQVQLVLARLLWDDQPVTVGALAELVWGEKPLADHWRGAVRGVLSKVRAAFVEAGIDAQIVTSSDGRVLVTLPPDFVVDVQHARAAVAAADEALFDGEAERASVLLAGWFDRLAQALLPAGDGAWVRDVEEQVEDLARRTLTLESRAALASGRTDRVESSLRRWLAVHPLDESVHHQLIEVLVATGRRTDARTALDRLRTTLEQELGVSPAPTTSQLVDGIDGIDGIDQGEGDGAGETGPTAMSNTRACGARGKDGEPATPPDPLLGRVVETVALRAAWESVQERGRPHLVLLRGPSGIGKTRLALELRAAVSAAGHHTMLCRCLPGPSLPFEPLASAITGGERSGSVSALRSELAATGAATDSALARARLFDLIATSVNLRPDEPALLVVDDIQWIDADGLELLEHLVTTSSTPLLVVATGRELPEGVHQTLARLARHLTVSSNALVGLSADELLPLFADGRADDPRAAANALHQHTGGHPFYISEIVEAARRSGSDIEVGAVPDAVREWISHRVDALPCRLRTRLDLVAIVGPGGRMVDLAACAQVPVDELLDELEELVDLGLLVEDEEIGGFALPHQIIRDVVCDRMGPSRRARLHHAVAEGLLAADPNSNPAVVAEHLLAAGAEHVDTATRLLSRAADDAYSQGAWALAAERQRAVLDVVAERPSERASALVGLARVLHLQGERAQAEACLTEALEVARTDHLPLALAEAVLVLVGRSGRGAGHLDDADQIRLLEEALQALERSVAIDPSPDDLGERRRRDSLRCRVEVELAVALSLWAPLERRTELAKAALERAEQLQPPDPDLHAVALLGAHTVRFGPDQVQAELDAEAEVLAIPLASRSLDTTLTALVYRYETLLRVGRRSEARRYLDAAVEVTERHDHPYWGWAAATWLAVDALIDGDLDEAERLAHAAATRPNTDAGGAMACLGVTLVNVRLYQGRSGEMLDLLGGAAQAHPEVPCYRAVLALCAAEAGELALAEQAYGPFRSSRFEIVPHDTNRLLALAVLADTAVALGDVDAAPDLWTLLAPYRGQHVLLNCYGGGGAYWGPVTGQLAGLATLAGRQDDADELLEEARRSAEAVASPLAVARLDPCRTGL